MADLRINIGAADNASPKISKVAAETDKLAASQGRMEASTASSMTGLIGWGAALAAAVKVTQAATEAFLADEQSMIKLRFATGALADSFASYASELQARTGADEDSTRAVQAMLYQYGVAPEVVNKATKALVDYAAVSGTDVKQAAEQLIKGADGGREAFRELGLVYDEAASKTQMVANITEALAKKVGGAAEADQGSLSHSLRVARAEFGELTEALGGFFARIEQKTGVIEAITVATRYWTKALQDLNATASGGPDFTPDPLSMSTQVQLRGPGGKPAVDRSVLGDEQMTKQARDKRDAAYKQWLTEREKMLKAAQKNAKEVADALGDGEDKQRELTEKHLDEQEKMQTEYADRERQDYIKRLRETTKLEVDAYELRKSLREKEAKEARQWGDAIGGAFAGALATQLNKLASGGELSPEETMIDVFTGVASVALTAAGFGWASPLVGAAGNFAKSSMRRHEGGWIGAPRMHGGAWVGADEQPAILQSGERVLSRQEVRGMGGQRGVDAAARGGQVVVNVSTFDGASATDYFTRAGGRALYNAVRTGRGSAGRLFGGG